MKQELNSAVGYQEGAIVSKEIMKSDAGTITLFAFSAGQGLSEHTAPFNAFVHILDGEAMVSISGEEQTVVAGEIIILPANKPHALRADKAFKMLLVMIRG